MTVCGSCGAENPDGFRFCGRCGADLSSGAAADVRKTVTVVFCDLVGSTALGERTDPELLREIMFGYHADLRSILERHGGTVEKFVGDAAMAVFGLPHVHEDDALRAVRAAAEMRDVVGRRGLEVRIGVNTGEVVSGAGETLVTGDAVNVAARLEQAASAGGILIGAQTERLVRGAVRTEQVTPLVAKGKSEPVAAFRLLELLPDAPAFTRRIDAPFVGRSSELADLDRAFGRAIADRVPHVCTLVGAPGIGKSRLAREFLGRVGGRARVVVGRCLPYGEGITYWPLGEIVRQVGGSEPRERIAGIVGAADGVVVADRLAGAVGLGVPGGSPEEIAWAARRLFEALAGDRPLIAVFDDVHWAESTLLDLIEYVVGFAADAPLLVLCTARSDLFDIRPSWSNPRPRALFVALEPLGASEAETLVGALDDVDASTCARIVDAADGNPLFVEQLLAMRAEAGDGELEVPPTLQALLSARIDRLEPDERAVVERASIEGRLFHRGSVAELLPEQARDALGAHLMALIRKELVRPDRSLFAGDDGYRFGHVLVRDTAYESMPKRLRAALHERFADWLEATLGDRVEGYDEILGYHLEQAYRYGVELGDASPSLARRVAERLGPAGRRALDRGDMEGARNLLARAARVLEEHSSMRIELEIELGDALLESGRLVEAEALLEGSLARTSDLGDPLLEARARVGLAAVQIQTHGPSVHGRIQEDVEPLVDVLEQAGDHRGAADALRLLGKLATWVGDYPVGSDLQERALVHARNAHDERREAAIVRFIVSDALWGPEPVASALDRCRGILSATTNGRIRANCLIRIGGLEGLAGRFDEARETIAQARAIMDELGLHHLRAHSTDVVVVVEGLSGDHVAAEREARAAYVVLGEMGDRTFQTAEAGLVAEALVAQGRIDEAEQWLEISLEGRDPDTEDLVLRARILAGQGRLVEAEEHVRAALEMGPQESVAFGTDAKLALAEILARAGRPDEARIAAEDALRRFEAKGVVPLMGRARALLESLPA